MNLTRLLIFHALFTLAAGAVLIVSPGLIPGTVGIDLNPGAYLICYLLGAGEISLAALSYFATRISDSQAIRLICFTFIILHGVTALVEVYAFSQGLSASIWGNVALRVVVIGLFRFYGIRKGGQ